MEVNIYNPYLKVVDIRNRKGVITQVDIPPGTPICEFLGKVYTDKQLEELKDRIVIDNVLQIGPNQYLGPSGNADDYIAHSCDPNAIVSASGCRAILYSLHYIYAGSEITFDYSTTSTDNPDSWKMNCTCGSFNCRKVISGFYNLPKELQEDYKKRNVAALFIRVPIFLRK